MYLWVVLWVQRVRAVVVYLVLCITGYETVSVSTDYGCCYRNLYMTVEDTHFEMKQSKRLPRR